MCCSRQVPRGTTLFVRHTQLHPRFGEFAGGLHPSFESLVAAVPYTPLALPRTVPAAGIYLLSEGSEHLYVGRSRRIKQRLANHCRPSATHKKAAFAFRLAREATGRLTATYRPEGSRSHLMQDPTFLQAFSDAKARIRGMQVRFVEEVDPTRQALLEIYAAVALGTRYNDFDTH